MPTEGTIKYRLNYTPAAPLPADALRTVDAWRGLLHRSGLIGQDPGRYEGYAYGNISMRLPPLKAPPYERRFVITGVQTGGRAVLSEADYASVIACNPARNQVAAEGPCRPSSESLTHATLYALDAALRCVIHIHEPVLWRHAAALGLPVTRPDVPYGSPEMAAEVERLYHETRLPALQLFAMGGHEDGLVAFGTTAEAAGLTLFAALARAYTRRGFTALMPKAEKK